MNLILFDDPAPERTLPAGDGRAAHLRDVLRMAVGDRFDVGVVGGARGKATILSDDERGMRLTIEWAETPPKPMGIHLLVGLPRPQTARKVLRECTSIGVAGIVFFASNKGEPAYRASKLWTTDEWRRHLRAGAEQAFTTHLPKVAHHDSLAEAVDAVGDSFARIALDVYEATVGLGEVVRGWGGTDMGDAPVMNNRLKNTDSPCGTGFQPVRTGAVPASSRREHDEGTSSDLATAAQAEACGSGEIARAGTCASGGVVLAVGPERGWSRGERDVLRGAGFVMAHLGERVLRTETACIAAVSMIAAGRGWL